MSPKLFIIGCCVSFFILSSGLFCLNWALFKATEDEQQDVDRFERVILTLTVEKCPLEDLSDRFLGLSGSLKAPSLESFIKASSTVQGQEQRLGGLAVYSNLTNACQTPVDISKSKSQVNKIALITVADPIADGAMCTFQDLALNAQNAGYSVLIYFTDHDDALITSYVLPSNNSERRTDSRDELVIPSLLAKRCSWRELHLVTAIPAVDDSVLLQADRGYAEIKIRKEDPLSAYIQFLYFWFPLGPLITLEWFRRKKKLCCLSGGQQVHEERATSEETGDQTGVPSDVEQSQADYNQETQNMDTRGEEQPLITQTTGHTRHIATGHITTLLAKIFGELAHGCGYVILLVAALPVGISSAGGSFFRFDEDEQIMPTFWDYLFGYQMRFYGDRFNNSIVIDGPTKHTKLIFDKFLPLWWSTFQIFCFFLYSRFACKITWTVPTNCSKLIRSDWFASNVYLLILGLVVPFCGAVVTDSSAGFLIYFAPYNTVCTICNLLFIIILNKHEFVTRYVFYISVCMICAYAESSVVAVYYYALNSEGSLNNLKLTALRTVALGLAFSLSFSSSMHIIRKLAKPRESLFETLGEK